MSVWKCFQCKRLFSTRVLPHNESLKLVKTGALTDTKTVYEPIQLCDACLRSVGQPTTREK